MPTNLTAKVQHTPADQGRAVAIIGSVLTLKNQPVNDADPLVFEHRERPGGFVPPHREPNSESFYVLEGTLEVDVEGQRYELRPGDFLSLPSGVQHSLRNAGNDWMRVLTTVTPGAAHVRFFTTVGEPIAPGTTPAEPAKTDVPRMVAVARDNGIEFAPPPGH
jgi:mannose-6-phosphate isomerase-like protein (cupin superfamily)